MGVDVMSTSNSPEKKYYWLKLRDDFFAQKEIKKLRKLAGGDTFTIIYLKLQLLSIKNEGTVYFESIEDSFAEEMALALDEDVGNVKMTLFFLEKCGLIEEISDSEYFLPEARENIGKESGSAERMRKHRQNKRLVTGDERVTSQCDGHVTTSDKDVHVSYTEKEIELYLNKDLVVVSYNNNINNSMENERVREEIVPTPKEDIKTDDDNDIYPTIQTKQTMPTSTTTQVEDKPLVKSPLRNLETELNRDGSPFKFFNENFMAITPFYAERIGACLDDGISGKVLIALMEQALANGVRKWGYIETSVRNCLNDNIRTYEQYVAHEAQRKRLSDSGNGSKYKSRDIPQMHNFQQRSYEEDEYEKYYVDVSSG
jgi:predicted phage replisome organizer